MTGRGRGFAALLLVGAIFVASALSLLRLQIDNAPAAYSPPDAPAVVFDRALREHFPDDQVLVLVFRAKDILSQKRLQALHRVADTLQQRKDVDRVLAVTTFDRIGATEDGFAVEPLIDPDALEETTAAQRRERALADRFAPGLLISEDADSVALIVRPHELQDSLRRLDLFQAAHRAVVSAALDDALVASAGQVALDVAQLRSMVRDSLVFIPATSAVGLLLIWWLYRRPLAVAVAFGAIGTMSLLTVAVVAVWGRSYTLVASMIPPLMAALTVALLIHVFNAMYHASRRGLSGAPRVRAALAEVRRPALYTALTTAAGLGSLALSPIQPIQTFGVAAGIGALLLFPVIMGLVPPILVAWDRGVWPRPRGLGRGLDWIVDVTARLAIRRAGWVIAITVLAAAVATPLLYRVQSETDLYQFFGEDHWLTQSTRVVERELSGVSQLEVVFDAGARDDLTDPQRLAELRKFQKWLDELPQVDRTLSMAELIEEMHWAFHGEQPEYRTLPTDGPLISQYLFIYDGRDLYELVNRDFVRTRLTMNLNVHGANEIQEVIDAITARLRAQPVADLEWRLAGVSNLFAEQEDLLVLGQIRSLWGALILIFLLMIWMWRSVPAALLCMLPNIAPVWFIFTAMGALGIRLDMATAMIASVAVGVAVDDTIHIYDGLRRRSRAGMALTVALLRTYRQAGRAVAATTLILCAQFLLLTMSEFVPTMQFGLLTAIGLAAALVFDLLLLPAVLVVLDRRRRRAAATALP